MNRQIAVLATSSQVRPARPELWVRRRERGWLIGKYSNLASRAGNVPTTKTRDQGLAVIPGQACYLAALISIGGKGNSDHRQSSGVMFTA
jgi:hypothetical protein